MTSGRGGPRSPRKPADRAGARENLSVWRTSSRLRKGVTGAAGSRRRSSQRRCSISFSSPAALASPVVRREIRLARQEGKPGLLGAAISLDPRCRWHPLLPRAVARLPGPRRGVPHLLQGRSPGPFLRPFSRMTTLFLKHDFKPEQSSQVIASDEMHARQWGQASDRRVGFEAGGLGAVLSPEPEARRPSGSTHSAVTQLDCPSRRAVSAPAVVSHSRIV
jgi:hypothetical protein